MKEKKIFNTSWESAMKPPTKNVRSPFGGSFDELTEAVKKNPRYSAGKKRR